MNQRPDFDAHRADEGAFIADRAGFINNLTPVLKVRISQPFLHSQGQLELTG
jgi:hypothetical protein